MKSLETRPHAEVELPSRLGLVEAVRVIDPDRAEGRHDLKSDARAPPQIRRVELARIAPDRARNTSSADSTTKFRLDGVTVRSMIAT